MKVIIARTVNELDDLNTMKLKKSTIDDVVFVGEDCILKVKCNDGSELEIHLRPSI